MSYFAHFRAQIVAHYEAISSIFISGNPFLFHLTVMENSSSVIILLNGANAFLT